MLDSLLPRLLPTTIGFEHQSKNRNRIYLVLPPCLFLLWTSQWKGMDFRFRSWPINEPGFLLPHAFYLAGQCSFWVIPPKQAAVVTVWHDPGGLVCFQKGKVKVNQTKWRCEIEMSPLDYPDVKEPIGQGASADGWQRCGWGHTSIFIDTKNQW